jgi:hypothetical protein
VLVPSWGADLKIAGAALAFLTTESALCVLLWVTLPSTSSASSTPVSNTDATHP